MKISMLGLQRELDDIRGFVNTIELQKNLLSYRSNQQNPRKYKRLERVVIGIQRHYNSFTSKRLFDYKTIIISLYGALERYLEELIKEYLLFLNEIIDDYLELPVKIKNSHVQLSAELLKKLEQQKYKQIMSENEIITNLNSCINDSKNYRLNVTAYTHHSSNFKHDTINNFFSTVDIYNISNKVQSHSLFQDYMSRKYPDGFTILRTQKEIEEKLNDLAQRRNEVAHGSECEILSNDILLTYIDFIEAYCKSINEIVFIESTPYLIRHKAILLNKPKYIYNNSIICFTLDNTDISIGDIILAKNISSNLFNYGEIKEIQVNNKKLFNVSKKANLDIGVRVDFHVNGNQEFYLYKRKEIKSNQINVKKEIGYLYLKQIADKA